MLQKAIQFADNIESHEAALRWRKNCRAAQQSGKSDLKARQLEHVHRGGPDYRSGQEINGQGIILIPSVSRGGEFGTG